MTQKTILPVNGVMNQDSAPAYVKEGEVYERRNARVVTIDGKSGHNTSLKGTMSVNSYIGHKALCSVEDIKRSRLLLFLKDTVSNNDKIIAVSKDNTTTTLYSSTVFNFNVNYPIEADIISDWLVWTDNYNPPRKLNISDVLTSIDENNIQLAVRPPYEAPIVQFGSDTSRKTNLIIGKSFQFALQYVYSDYTYSTLSPYSKIAVSSSIFAADTQTYVDDNTANYVGISYNLGSDEVSTVKIYAREGNSGNWFLIEEYDKNGETAYSYGSFSFYNDKARQQITNSEALAFYSDVPLKAQSILTVKNRVGLAGVTKGYDKTGVSVTYGIEYGDVDVEPSSIDIPIGDIIYSNDFYIYWDIPTIVQPDDVGEIISVSINSTYNFYSTPVGGSETLVLPLKVLYSASYVVKVGDVKADVVNFFLNDINTKSDTIFSNNGESIGCSSVTGVYGDVGITSSGMISPLDVSRYTVDRSNTGSILKLASGVNTFKAGSYYNVGIVGYDEFGRTSGVLGGTRVYVPSNGDRTYADAYKQARITFDLSNTTLPSWVKYYRFAVSESINILSVYPFVTGSSTSNNIIDTYLDNKPVFAINMPTNVDYVFAKGDYLVVEKDGGSSISTITKNILGVRSIIDIGASEIAGNFIIVTKGSQLTTDYIDNIAYVVRPKSETEDVIYYEDYRTYRIINGVPETTIGYVGDGDAWFVSRKYKWDANVTEKTETVEDFTISVDDGLRSFSKGRSIVDFGDLGVQKQLQHFVWSKQYLTNTKINGLAFFESTARIELDEKNGDITSIKLIGDIIKVIQPNKETSLYVGKQQVTNADGTLTLTSTANFVGTVYPLASTSGSTNKKSICTNDNFLYYWDEGRGDVIRSGNNGQQSINGGMNSYFKALKKTLDSATWTNIVFHYDDRYNELICAFSWLNGTYNTVTIVYSELLQGWTYFYDLNYGLNGADIFGSIGEKNYCFNSGMLHELDANSAYNTFFNVVKAFSITSYANIYPSQEKVLKSLLLDSNKGLATTVESDVANTRPYGHYTVLVSGSYRNREGLYASTVNRNIRVASGATNSSLLYSGDLMTGKWFKIGLTTSDSTLTELKFVHVGYNGSN